MVGRDLNTSKHLFIVYFSTVFYISFVTLVLVEAETNAEAGPFHKALFHRSPVTGGFAARLIIHLHTLSVDSPYNAPHVK